MRYALIIAFILGLTTSFTAFSDEVGSGYICPDCMTGLTTTTDPIDTVERDSDDGAGEGGGGSGGGGWFAKVLGLFVVAE